MCQQYKFPELSTKQFDCSYFPSWKTLNKRDIWKSRGGRRASRLVMSFQKNTHRKYLNMFSRWVYNFPDGKAISGMNFSWKEFQHNIFESGVQKKTVWLVKLFAGREASSNLSFDYILLHSSINQSVIAVAFETWHFAQYSLVAIALITRSKCKSKPNAQICLCLPSNGAINLMSAFAKWC